jgi:UDP-3-O-[3-hydroxymyristoyl] N-acetylglucosamine deacetylase / 3-hydroxyacyl-[acyl-carrier-protein] dehydratase
MPNPLPRLSHPVRDGLLPSKVMLGLLVFGEILLALVGLVQEETVGVFFRAQYVESQIPRFLASMPGVVESGRDELGDVGRLDEDGHADDVHGLLLWPDSLSVPASPVIMGNSSVRSNTVAHQQKTISREVSLDGPGLFSGELATLTLSPAEKDTGITFVREQDARVATIPATIGNVLKRPRRTCLRNGSLFVETVEHCLAALSGMGINNAVAKLSGGLSGEIPGGDGSSKIFVDAIAQAGVVEQDAPVRPLIIRKPVQVSIGDATLAALPGPTDRLEIIYDFEAGPPLGRQTTSFHLGNGSAGSDDFVQQLAPARTFVFEHEAAELRARGLGRHLTPRDLLVIAPDGPIDNTFRFPDECARHKMLDLIGDLALVGRPIYGRLLAHKSGHHLNHQLARKLLEQQAAESLTALVGREGAMDIRSIQRILPHRYPMLLVDRVVELEGDQRAVGIKNVTFNDIFFQGHYPGTPIMPGVLIVEALAQLGGILLSRKLEHTGKLAVLLSMDKVKMRQPVVPGDQLILEAVTVRVKSRTGHVRCKAFVQDKMAAEADIKFMLVDAEPV